MKKNRILSIVLIIVFCFTDVSLAASNSIGVAKKTIKINNQNKTVNMVTGSNLNMNELAKVMVELGAVKAMNLDGGASSGLYAKDNMITNPGRKLNTVLMIYINESGHAPIYLYISFS